MRNTYEVIESNIITNGKYTVRWTGSKVAPQFVAKDVAEGIGYSAAWCLYNKFETPDYVDSERGKRGRILMRSLSIAQVNEALTLTDKRLRESRDAFREFWENTVLPVFDEKYAVIASQKREIARLKTDNATLKAENATLAEDLGKANEKITSIKSLVA